MTDQTTPNDLSWLNWENEKQMKWALNYFSKKGFVCLAAWSSKVSTDSLKAWLEERSGSADTELLLGKAKNAWRQQKNRKHNPGYKAYNFVLPTEVQATLKQLAGMQRTNMTEALKKLIGEAWVAEKHHQKELKVLREEHKQALENLRRGQSETQKRLTEQKKKAEQQIKTYAKSKAAIEHTTKELAAEAKELLWHKVENELQITRESALPDERASMDELHTEELEKLRRRFKLQSGFDIFSDRPNQRAAPHRTPRSSREPR